MNRCAIHGMVALAAVLVPVSAQAAIGLIDFETGDSGALVNGKAMNGQTFMGGMVSVSSTGANSGAAIFNTNPAGPNLGGPDPDLLVGLGNVMILQEATSPTQSVAGIFDTPNDAPAGKLIFTFAEPTQLFSLDIADIEFGQSAHVDLFDAANRRLRYYVRGGFTYDIDVDGPQGYHTLDLTTLSNQTGENGGVASAYPDAGFDPLQVTALHVSLNGSGGVDNIRFAVIPEPASLGLLTAGGLLLGRRRR